MCSVFYITDALCQDNLLAIKTSFSNYSKQAFQEKIYVHTDKHFYIAGEIIWFKVYNVDACFHKPISLSKVAYAEVLDKNNKPVLQAKIALKDAAGSGSFFIPVDIPSGKYKLRTYTNWMKNYSEDFFFEKVITIINTQQVTQQPARNKPAVYDVELFPEGGNLVQGLQSKVAFKVTNENGKGESFTGFIVRNNTDTIATFNPLQFGIGTFTFTPGADRYEAVIKLPDGNIITKDFPKIYPEGFVMKIDNAETDALKITVQCNVASQQQVFLFAHTRQLIKKAEAAVIKNGIASFTINKKTLVKASHISPCSTAINNLCANGYILFILLNYYRYKLSKTNRSMVNANR
jgi:hypothetical protein